MENLSRINQLPIHKDSIDELGRATQLIARKGQQAENSNSLSRMKALDKNDAADFPITKTPQQQLSYRMPHWEFEHKAERGGFEPPVPCGTLVFETSTIGHSVTSPCDAK